MPSHRRQDPDASGAPAGSEFLVNTYTTESQGYPSVAAGPDGRFMVVWVGHAAAGGSAIFGRQFAPDLIFYDGFEPGTQLASGRGANALPLRPPPAERP